MDNKPRIGGIETSIDQPQSSLTWLTAAGAATPAGTPAVLIQTGKAAATEGTARQKAIRGACEVGPENCLILADYMLFRC